MRDHAPLFIFSFVVGALIAAGGVWYWMARDSAQAFVLFALGDGVKAHERAMQAYQHEEPTIAIWELRHLAELQNEHLRRGVDSPRSLQLELFLTHGRLAKLYQQLTNQSEAQSQMELAISAYRGFSPTNTTITNLSTLVEWIQKFDAQAKKETRFGNQR